MTTPSAQLSKDAQGTLAEIRQALPAECQTPQVVTALNRLDEQIKQIPATCKVERRQARKNAGSFILGILATLGVAIIGLALAKKI